MGTLAVLLAVGVMADFRQLAKCRVQRNSCRTLSYKLLSPATACEIFLVPMRSLLQSVCNFWLIVKFL